MRAGYIVQEAGRTIARNRGGFLLAATVQGICLLLLSIFVVLTANLEQLARASARKIELYAFLDDAADAAATEQRIAALGGVSATRYVSRDGALEELRGDLGSDQSLLEAFGENPLPASVRATIHPDCASAEDLADIERKVSLLPGVVEVWSGREIVARLSRILKAVRFLDAGISAFVLLAVLFIAVVTVEASIGAKRSEVEIMELVGASNAAVRLPFVIEGVCQSVGGGLCALLLAYVMYRVVSALVPAPAFPLAWVAAVDLGLGALLGLFGAMLALQKVKGTPARNWQRADSGDGRKSRPAGR
jgi:cell division transport system permease protein